MFTTVFDNNAILSLLKCHFVCIIITIIIILFYSVAVVVVDDDVYQSSISIDFWVKCQPATLGDPSTCVYQTLKDTHTYTHK